MKTTRLRSEFLRFFEARDHTVVSSAPLVPDDPSLLFTNAGMVPFKDVFIGREERPYDRAASVQRCLRVTGKHNDLETVGPSPRHHTFFEMLGNFSFGAYFKEEAIHFAWDFVTGPMDIDPDRLVLTVHRDDDEARRIWTESVGAPAERVLAMGDATNFWMMADVGPCGPTSELHYDFGPDACTCRQADCSVLLDNDCGRWLEVWNLVFMQFDRASDGSRAPLPQTGVDTGMGLERLAAVKQGVESNYDTDLFLPIMDCVQQLLGHTDRQRAEHVVGYRVLADHGRAMTFLVSDGVLPGNDGRNYVLRLIMRRAMRFGRMLGFEEPFLVPLTEVVGATMRGAHPELEANAGWIAEVVSDEEARFARTLESGLTLLDEVLGDNATRASGEVPGETVFRLYDTFGFPPDLTRVVAEEHGLTIDRDGFERAMEAQRARAREGASFDIAELDAVVARLDVPPTRFTGYEQTEGAATIVALVVGDEPAEEAGEGQSVLAVMDETPFYAEAGGQVGDTGVLEGPEGTMRVDDTQQPVPGVIAHRGVVTTGRLATGHLVRARIDAGRRADIMRNHTATHLLHAALQEELGEHAQQRGSLVAPDRLRFDFAHLKSLTPDELRRIEERVAAWVRADKPVSWQVQPIDDAKAAGATMLFGEKYGADVRVVSIDGTSKELCGGTHLTATGQIGSFVITSEGSVGSGLRRIEARTGRSADAFVRERLDLLDAAAAQVGVRDVAVLPERLTEIKDRTRELEWRLDDAQARLAAHEAASLAAAAVEVDGARVLAARVDAHSADALRSQVDALRPEVDDAVIVLGAVIDEAPRLVAAVAEPLVARGVHAGDLVKSVAGVVGGGGGGRPQLAEAGGRDAERLDDALAVVADLVREALRDA